MSAFHVGQKVVHVHKPGAGGHVPRRSDANYPIPGEVYTVRAIVTCFDGSPYLLLCEIDNRHLEFRIEPAFGCCHFRPVAYPKQSLEHDVQLFTKIADRVPAPKRRVRA